MHIALVNVPANIVNIRMESRVTDTPVPWLQVFTSSVLANARDHLALINVRSTVVFAGARRAENLVILGAILRTWLAGYTPTQT